MNVARLLVAGAAALLVAPAFAADPTPQYPLAVVASGDGALYLADRNLPGVWKLADDKLSLVFQASKKFRTPLNAVRCLAIDKDGRVIAGDSATRDVFRLDAAGQPQPLTNGEIGIPMAIAVDGDGHLLVADLELHQLVKVPAAGGKPVLFASVPAPRGLAIDKDGRVWVVSHGADQVLRLSPDGKSKEVVVAGRPFGFPHHLVLDDDGTAYVADGYLPGVWKVPPGQPPVKLASGEPFKNPVGFARSGDKLFVLDPRVPALFTLDREGKIGATRSLSTP
jgi:streptogramin lyase